MGIITKPYTFASGRVIDGTQVNANFDALIAGLGDTATLRPTLASLGAVATGDSRLSDARTPTAHTHGLNNPSFVPPAMIDSLTTANFRTVLFGNNAGGYNLAPARWNTPPSVLAPLMDYGTMMAWSAYDTHGFLALNYSTPGAVVGGGVTDRILWTKRLAFSDDARFADARLASDVYPWAKAASKPAYSASEVSALPIAGGTMTGELKAPLFDSITATVSSPNNTATTIYTFPNTSSAFWLASVDLGDVGDATNYGVFAIIHTLGPGARIMQNLPAGFSAISLSGLSIQVTQTSGGSQIVHLTLTRVA